MGKCVNPKQEKSNKIFEKIKIQSSWVNKDVLLFNKINIQHIKARIQFDCSSLYTCIIIYYHLYLISILTKKNIYIYITVVSTTIHDSSLSIFINYSTSHIIKIGGYYYYCYLKFTQFNALSFIGKYTQLTKIILYIIK